MDRAGEKNVVSEREKNIERMRKKVKKAIAKPVSLEKYIAQSSEKEVEEYLKTRTFKDHDIGVYQQEDDPSGTVIIKDSHDYPLLLQMVAEELTKVSKISFFLREDREDVEENLAHEYQHHVPALGQPELTTLYGVRILKDRLGDYAYQPFLRHKGRVPYYVYKDIMSAPPSLSDSDKRRIGNK